jgi:hypothetical protein
VEGVLAQGYRREESAYQDIENKRMKYINKLTLAERLGLVDKPPEPLSQTEWVQIEKTFFNRVSSKQIKEETCPICFENLQFAEQTILSCSHVYHKTCLESFERFMRNKGSDKACPICRKENYDKKPFVAG